MNRDIILNKKIILGAFAVFVMALFIFIFINKRIPEGSNYHQPTINTDDYPIFVYSKSLSYYALGGVFYSKFDGTIKKLNENEFESGYFSNISSRPNLSLLLKETERINGSYDSILLTLDRQTKLNELLTIHHESADFDKGRKYFYGGSISPDESKIAYITIDITSPSHYKEDLYVMEKDGSQKRLVESFINKNLDVRMEYYKILGWSKDMTKLYFIVRHDIQQGAQRSGLWAFNFNNNILEKIDDSKEIFIGATLSPDGTKIAYEPYDKTDGIKDWVPTNPHVLRILDLETGAKETIDTDAILTFGSFLWSEDSSKLIYAKYDQQPSYWDQYDPDELNSFLVFDIISKKSNKILQGLEPEKILGWIPNQEIVFTTRVDNSPKTNEDDTISLYSVKFDGSEYKTIDTLTGLGSFSLLGAFY